VNKEYFSGTSPCLNCSVIDSASHTGFAFQNKFEIFFAANISINVIMINITVSVWNIQQFLIVYYFHAKSLPVIMILWRVAHVWAVLTNTDSNIIIWYVYKICYYLCIIISIYRPIYYLKRIHMYLDKCNA